MCHRVPPLRYNLAQITSTVGSLPRLDADMHRTATASSLPVCSLGTHSADTESHPASAVATDTLGNPLHFESERRIPSHFEDNRPSSHTRYCGLVSQADIHHGHF